MICKQCGIYFKERGGWQRECVDCYKKIRGTTTPASETQHPAFVYERAHPEQDVDKATSEQAQHWLEQLQELMIIEEEEDVGPESPSMLTCQHTFLHSYHGFDQCSNCMIFKHQFLYSMQVKPSADEAERR